MKEGRPSQTASLVALLRALADAGITRVPHFRDPTARKMLAPSWAERLARVEKLVQHRPRGALHEAMRRGADMLALRTLIIDAYLRDALARGARQLVILGAGLDGRAFRLPELANVNVFEVDHPATQEFKKSRAVELTPAAKRVTFVAHDFELDSLEPRLFAAGHRADQPTVWIWEGVVMYLTDHAMRETLRAIASMSASNSTAVVNYHTEKRSVLLNFLLTLWGEPQVNARDPAAMAAELSLRGFRVVEDTGSADWAARFHAPIPDFRGARSPRVLVAHR